MSVTSIPRYPGSGSTRNAVPAAGTSRLDTGCVAHASRHGSGKDATHEAVDRHPVESNRGVVGDKAVRKVGRERLQSDWFS